MDGGPLCLYAMNSVWQQRRAIEGDVIICMFYKDQYDDSGA